jgi:hypothetical protein
MNPTLSRSALFALLVSGLVVGHDGTLTGKAHATETLEDGTRCDSGPVTLQAMLKG